MTTPKTPKTPATPVSAGGEGRKELVDWAANEVKRPPATKITPKLPPKPVGGKLTHAVPAAFVDDMWRLTDNIPGLGGVWRLYRPSDFGKSGKPYYHWVSSTPPGSHPSPQPGPAPSKPKPPPYQYGSHEPPSEATHGPDDMVLRKPS